MFIPMKFSRNLGQFVSRTKFVRGDGSNPLFLHGILVNITGLLALVGLILVATQLQSLTDTDNTMAIVMFSSVRSSSSCGSLTGSFEMEAKWVKAFTTCFSALTW